MLAFDDAAARSSTKVICSPVGSIAWRILVDWKAGHSRGEPAAALRHIGRNLRHIGRNLIRARGIAVISAARGGAIYVGQTSIAVVTVSGEIGSVVIIECSAVGPERVIIAVRPKRVREEDFLKETAKTPVRPSPTSPAAAPAPQAPPNLPSRRPSRPSRHPNLPSRHPHSRQGHSILPACRRRSRSNLCDRQTAGRPQIRCVHRSRLHRSGLRQNGLRRNDRRRNGFRRNDRRRNDRRRLRRMTAAEVDSAEMAAAAEAAEMAAAEAAEMASAEAAEMASAEAAEMASAEPPK